MGQKIIMQKQFKKIYITLLTLAFFVPLGLSASTVYIDSSQTEFHVGDRAVLNVRLNTEGKSINTVEGNISLDIPIGVASVGDLSLSQSSFSLWPRKPSLSANGRSISFVGGIPNGLNSDNAILFKIIINLEKPGSVNFAPNDVVAYLNDGKGTKQIVSPKDLNLNVLQGGATVTAQDTWKKTLSDDKTPPESFEVILGQEGSVFDGKKFLSFSTIDKQSDVKYYEVIEGNNPPVRSGNTYVLQNQDKVGQITVLAYDSAGNVRKEVFNKSYANLYYILAVLVLLRLVMWIYKKRKNGKTDK
jgi:hypothetical protein